MYIYIYIYIMCLHIYTYTYIYIYTIYGDYIGGKSKDPCQSLLAVSPYTPYMPLSAKKARRVKAAERWNSLKITPSSCLG